MSEKKFLSEKELAQRWGLNPNSLKHKRLVYPQTVPAFLKLSSCCVRYSIDDILEFEKSKMQNVQA